MENNILILKGGKRRDKMLEKLGEIYDKIKNESKEIYSSNDATNYNKLFAYFTENMGYGSNYRHRGDLDECCSIQIEDRLLIQGYCYNNTDKAIKSLTSACEKYDVEWGILLHHKCIALVNSDIECGNVAYKDNKIVFKIDYSRPYEKQFFKYFTYDNLLRKRNACYFRDIIMYKNMEYTGDKKCWGAYCNGLRRFLSYVSEQNEEYKNDIYSKIKLSDMEKYIRMKGNVKSDKTIKNYFFYVKDFMVRRTQNGQFDCGAEVLCNMLKELTSKYTSYTEDVYEQPDKIRNLIKIIRTKQNRDRNEILLLLMLSFGMERRTICELRWNENFRENDIGMMEIKVNENWYCMPSMLSDKMKKMKKERVQGADYVFGSRETVCKKQLPEESINTILNSISSYDSKEEFYKYITIGNVRKNLFSYLMKQHYDLLSIMQMLKIEPSNLTNFIDNKVVVNNEEHEDMKTIRRDMHPMEEYICMVANEK